MLYSKLGVFYVNGCKFEGSRTDSPDIYRLYKIQCPEYTVPKYTYELCLMNPKQNSFMNWNAKKVLVRFKSSEPRRPHGIYCTKPNTHTRYQTHWPNSIISFRKRALTKLLRSVTSFLDSLAITNECVSHI